jgi:hypothetical protein
MAKRLFEDNDAWEDVTSRCNHEVESLFADVLAKVEATLGEPVDLRDFHFVGANALTSFVAELSIRRRLGDGDEAPRDKSYYPRLARHEDEDDFLRLKLHDMDDPNIVEGLQKWECSVMLDGSPCLYQELDDPMHDECVNCGEPEERK